MIKALYSSVLFFCLFSCNSNGQKNISQKNDSLSVSTPKPIDILKDSSLVIYSYGIDSRGTHIDQRIAEKYGFQYISAGCTMSEEQMKDAEENNKKVRLLLEKRNGKDWEKRFEEDLAKARKLNNEVIALVYKQQFIINLNKKLKEEKRVPYIVVNPIGQSNTFDVTVSSWDEEKQGLMLYYNLKVNMENKEIAIENDKQELIKK